MALNPSFAGRTYPPSSPYEVGREKIREFARAVGETNPACYDVEAARALGYPDLIAPPTFPIVLSLDASMQVIEDPESGLDYSRVVHGDQSFEYVRPVYAGDVLQVEASVHELKSLRGNEVVTTRGDIRTIEGEFVGTVYCTLVARGLDTAMTVRA